MEKEKKKSSTGSPTKTYSRELSLCMMVFVGWLAYQGMTQELEILVWPVTLFSMASFGFKQGVVKDIAGRTYT